MHQGFVCRRHGSVLALFPQFSPVAAFDFHFAAFVFSELEFQSAWMESFDKVYLRGKKLALLLKAEDFLFNIYSEESISVKESKLCLSIGASFVKVLPGVKEFLLTISAYYDIFLLSHDPVRLPEILRALNYSNWSLLSHCSSS